MLNKRTFKHFAVYTLVMAFGLKLHAPGSPAEHLGMFLVGGSFAAMLIYEN
jgi:hypothetical protein